MSDLKVVSPDELKRSLELHRKWLFGEPGGERANLWNANLRNANLGNANLRYANLRNAKWNDATQWPAITTVLLANWGVVSDELCRDLMRYDAACHPDPSAFDRWATGGPCPYDGVRVQRAAQFAEKKGLWSPGSVRAYDVFTRLLAEKLVKVA